MSDTANRKQSAQVVDTPSALVIQAAGAVLTVAVVILKIRRAVQARRDAA
jgi:hypothetical protein